MILWIRFFFDLMIKSMVEYLASVNSMDSPRKHRFSEQYLDDIATLVTTFTSDIISGYNRDIKVSRDGKMQRKAESSHCFLAHADICV